MQLNLQTPSIETLKRQAKTLRAEFAAGEAAARDLVAEVLQTETLSHAQALYVIARQEGFESWPKLKTARDLAAMDRNARAERLETALFHAQHWTISELLRDDPSLGRANFGLECALYDVAAVRQHLARDPACATRLVGKRRPILHLAFSRHEKGAGDASDMLAVADLLLAHGADVNDGFAAQTGDEDILSALYGAIGHGDNMALGRWLLTHGATPDDNESLYHATELGHREGLKLLLEFGANPAGTNALARALDFDDAEAVALLLKAGADPNEGLLPHSDGKPNHAVPSLHQAARRQCTKPIVALLLEYGADASAVWQEHSAYELARVYGNRDMADLLETHGGGHTLSPPVAMLARAADGTSRENDWLDMAQLSPEMSRLLVGLVAQPGSMGHMKRLVRIGMDSNVTDLSGLPPFHLAAWLGLPEQLTWLLSLSPDMSHENGFGGTLFSTILHGAENCPDRAKRDHLACMKLALELGVALPRRALTSIRRPDMAEFVSEWAAARPGQVVETGAY